MVMIAKRILLPNMLPLQKIRPRIIDVTIFLIVMTQIKMGDENKPLVYKIWIMILLRYEKKEAQKQRSLIPRFSYKFTAHIVFHKTDIIFIKWYITHNRDAETYVLMFYGHQSSLLFVVWFSFTTFFSSSNQAVPGTSLLFCCL